jgi:hypothetical protein
VPAHEQRDEDLFEHLVLTDDYTPDLFDDASLRLLKALYALAQFRRIQ